MQLYLNFSVPNGIKSPNIPNANTWLFLDGSNNMRTHAEALFFISAVTFIQVSIFVGTDSNSVTAAFRRDKHV